MQLLVSAVREVVVLYREADRLVSRLGGDPVPALFFGDRDHVSE
jgi:hypothetical protein